MSVWHEPIPPEINHSFSTDDGRVRAIIRRRGEGAPLMPKREPDKWVVLTPRAEVSEATLGAAKERARGLMEQINRGEWDDGFDIAPYSPPVPLEGVREMDHAGGRIKALVLRRADGRHEVRYFAHELLGVWSKSQTEEWDWVRTRWDTATYADSLAEAEEVARAVTNELATQKAPSVRQRFA